MGDPEPREEPHSLKRRAIKGAIWTAFGGNTAQILAFVIFVAISRVVGPETFGAIAVSLLIVELARACTSECIIVNLLAQGRFYRASFDAAFVLGASASVLVAAGLIAASPILAHWLNVSALSQVMPKLAPLLVIHAIARLLEAELTLRMAFRALAVRSVGAVVLSGGVGITAAYAGLGLDALVLQQWTWALASLGLIAWQANWRPGFRLDLLELRALARQSAAMAPAGLISNLRMTLDGLAVASFSGAAAAGLYNLAKRSRLALQLGVTAAIGRVALPTLAQLKESRARMGAAASQAMRLGAITAFPIFIGLGAVAPEMIEIALGREWLGAATPMTILLIGGALATTTGLCESALLICGRRASIVTLHACVLLALLLAVASGARFGPIGVAAAVAIVNAGHNAAAWRLAARELRLKLRDYASNILAPFAISLAMLAIIGALRGDHAIAALPLVAQMLVLIGFGAVFYFAASWLFARSTVITALNAARMIITRTPAVP